jgi:hypothetical protein
VLATAAHSARLVTLCRYLKDGEISVDFCRVPRRHVSATMQKFPSMTLDPIRIGECAEIIEP